VVEHARLRPANFPPDHHCRGLLVRVPELRITVDIAGIRQFDSFEPVKKIDVPPISAKFPVRYRRESDAFLQFDCLPYTLVFNGTKIRSWDLSLLCAGARFMKFCGSQEAADMIGVEKQFL
jgi:hypothetical protein